MEKNILCERTEQTVLSNLFDGLSTLLQDSDDTAQKDKIKKALQRMTDTTTYIALGESGAGKSSLLRALFCDVLETAGDMEGDICEYRWGDAEFTTPVSNGFQKKFLTSENMKGLSIIDTKGLNGFKEVTFAKVKETVENCDAIFVVLDANHITSSRLWDLVESLPAKRMLFFLTKCDQISSEELVKNVEKVKCYMEESKISAPIFPVSITKDQFMNGTTALEEVRLYIRNQLIGPNPILSKQRQNVEEARELLVLLQESFARRKQQYVSDAEILRKINYSMDDYVENHQKVIDDLIEKLTIEINKDIDDYEKEIISKLDPYKIKERFKEKEDFEYYLNMVNDNYRTMMSNSINRKTIEAIKGCLHDLEIVFQEAVGYFNTRENIMELNDRFYGSLSKGRQSMAKETKGVIVATGELYRTLSDASETLFLQIWNERKKYDARIRKSKDIAIGAGGGAGAVGGLAVAGIEITKAGEAVKLGAVVASVLGAPAWVGTAVIVSVSAIVLAVTFRTIAKEFYAPYAAGKMEEAARKCIEEFKREVDNTRVKMIKQISAQITEIFERELAQADGCFTDFRISVNIDERRIPLLEQKMTEVEKMLEQINNL